MKKFYRTSEIVPKRPLGNLGKRPVILPNEPLTTDFLSAFSARVTAIEPFAAAAVAAHIDGDVDEQRIRKVMYETIISFSSTLNDCIYLTNSNDVAFPQTLRKLRQRCDESVEKLWEALPTYGIEDPRAQKIIVAAYQDTYRDIIRDTCLEVGKSALPRSR
jgi:hypothetical protein